VTACPYGFRIVGATSEERRLVDAGAVLAAYACCDERAEVTREAYLSAFQFGEDFRQLLESTGSPKGFAGPCWSAWVWLDIDRDGDLDAALRDARRLVAAILERYATLDDDDLLAFFSGAKGFHVGIPSCVWGPHPSADFHRTARRFAERLADAAGVGIDHGVYDRVRPFRAPNSRHPRTGLHKRRLSHAELMALSLDAMLGLSATPSPFDVPRPAGHCHQAAADWLDATTWVAEQAEARAQRRAAGHSTAALNRLTLDFIRDGAGEGDRHRLLFSSAANLREFGCPAALAHALLTPPALDSGLAPGEVHRQIECGLAHGVAEACTSPDPGPATATAKGGPADGSPSRLDGDKLKAALAALWSAPAWAPADTPAGNDPCPALPGVPAGSSVGGQGPGGFLKAPPAIPNPPSGAAFFFQDSRGRPCEGAAAYMWTWAGAPQWFYVAEHPVPIGRLQEGGA
jgi:hypothetical protein